MSEEKTYPQMYYPFGQKLHVEINGNPRATVATLDGKPIPGLREITVTSDVDADMVSFDVIHLPSGQPITVDGYLIEESDWHYLRAARKAGFKP